MRIPFGLDFQIINLKGELKEEFLASWDGKSKSHNRLAIIFGILFYAVFGILDNVLIPEKAIIFWTIRYLIVIPIAVFVIIVSYLDKVTRLLQPLIAASVSIAGIGIVYMIVISEPPVSYNYYAGLLLMFIFGYGF